MTCCRDKYNSPVHAAPAGYLVVEGYISNDTGATRIRLTRSVRLDSASTVLEPGATILVEAKSGGTVATLTQISPGYYSGHVPAVNSSELYRIHITTSGNRQYFSDYSSPRDTPPIDSVSWTADSAGVKIFVTAHDASWNTVNYHWEFDETWEHEAAFNSMLVYRYPRLYPRDSSLQIYKCYTSESSSSVLIATTAGLTKDEVSLYKIADISFSASNRLISKYSINVKQHAMSTEALNYYQLLAKNTEQLGSIFDAQPSALTGNLHSATDPGEPVIGYIECSAKTEKRIYIDRDQLNGAVIYPGHEPCGDKFIAVILDTTLAADTLLGTGANIPVSGSYGPDSVYGLHYSTFDCVDCRVQGGVTSKPAFWP